MFPKDFVWGVASSAYQVEGTDAKDGRGKNIWDEFARSGRVYEHQTAEVCCDHMHRYREDFALMRMLGIKIIDFPSAGRGFFRREPGRSTRKLCRCIVI